jgi:hypothetical protein
VLIVDILEAEFFGAEEVGYITTTGEIAWAERDDMTTGKSLSVFLGGMSLD